KFTETLIKEQSFGDALSEGLETTIKAGVLKGVNSGVGKLADAAEIDTDILGKAIEKLPGKWGGKIGTVADRINGNKEIIKKIGEANYNYDISFGFLMEYKVVSSIKSSVKSNIKKHPREYIETKIETKLEKKRINDIFCPA